MLTICTRSTEFERVRAIAEAYPDVWCSVGIHPHEAARPAGDRPRPLIALARASEGRRDRRDRARLPLRPQPARAPGAGVPRPCRGGARDRPAADRPRPRRRRARSPRCCARSGRAARRRYCIASAAAGSSPKQRVDLGFYISISGIVTFRTPRICARSSRDLPLDRLLVETDAPYLAPVPYRGKRNEPAFVVAHRRGGRGAARASSRNELAARDDREFLPPVRQGAAARRRPA